MIRRKLIESLGADPTPDEAYTALRGVLIPFRRNEDCVSGLSPRDHRIFPILIDIAESGVKAGLKAVRLKADGAPEARSAPSGGELPDLKPCLGLGALRLAVIGLLTGLILSGAHQTFDLVLEICAVAILAMIETAPHLARLRDNAVRLFHGRDKRPSQRNAQANAREPGGASPAHVQTAQTDEASAPRPRLSVDASAFVDQLFDVLLSVDKILHLVREPAPPQPKTLISDKDALALMQDLIAARMDGDGERALILLRQIEPLLLAHGVSVHPYCPELAGMFTIQSGPEGTAPATVRPAMAADGRVVAFGVAETPRPPEGTASSQPEN